MKTFLEFIAEIEPSLLEGEFPFKKKDKDKDKDDDGDGWGDEKGDKKPSAFEKFAKKKEGTTKDGKDKPFPMPKKK